MPIFFCFVLYLFPTTKRTFIAGVQVVVIKLIRRKNYFILLFQLDDRQSMSETIWATAVIRRKNNFTVYINYGFQK